MVNTPAGGVDNSCERRSICRGGMNRKSYCGFSIPKSHLGLILVGLPLMPLPLCARPMIPSSFVSLPVLNTTDYEFAPLNDSVQQYQIHISWLSSFPKNCGRATVSGAP